MIIRREALSAALAATTADDTRYHLNSLCVEPDGRVVATNGHVLLIAADKTPIADADFPIVAGAEFHGTPSGQTLIAADVVKGMIATMPKRPTIPVLGCVQISANGTPSTATVAATDLQAPRVATVDSSIATFPQYGRVMPSATQAVRIVLAVEVLETLIKAAKAVNLGKNARPSITFDIPENDKQSGCVMKAVHVSIKGTDVDVTGAAMPMRL